MIKSTHPKVSIFFQTLQDEICSSLSEADGKEQFREDNWKRPEGGGGKTRIISNGSVFEKGGVNFSEVYGKLPEMLSHHVSPGASEFLACGVSIVIHPFNPHVPTIHMNVRYFETDKGDAWFGGGIDLTPAYVNEIQAKNFHRLLKQTCDKNDKAFYQKFKQWADDYFFIPHRNETRGVGGIFYDYLGKGDENNFDKLFQFNCDVGRTFIPAYLPIVNMNKDIPFTESEKQWQLLRRGRYVEFNLVYDRGTRFGLETGGRTESILMSLPEQATWLYNHQPVAGSREEQTQSFLKKGIDWIS